MATKMEAAKKVGKSTAEVSGLGIAFVLSKILESQGIPLSEDELLVLGGVFTSIGSSIKHLLL